MASLLIATPQESPHEVTKRLYMYLSRDLIRVTFLALVAFTLVMTVFAIMEPLRKQGLSASHAMAVVGYTVPVMLSLTLPIAALFAATMVYGKFAQDNELVACQAGGISTITILKPAIVLGLVVSVISLALNNYVAPQMARRVQQHLLQGDAQHMLFQQLKTKGYVQLGQYLIHADIVDQSNDTLGGVVFGQITKNSKTGVPAIYAVVASKASIGFNRDEDDGVMYVRVVMEDPVPIQAGNYDMLKIGKQPAEIPLDALENKIKDKPAWYDWDTLLATLKKLETSSVIQRRLADLRREIARSIFAQEFASGITAGQAYELGTGSGLCSIRARSAAIAYGEKGAVTINLVEPEVTHGGSTARAQSGLVEANWSPFRRVSLVTVSMTGTAVRTIASELPLPEAVVRQASALSLSDILTRGGTLTGDPLMQNRIRQFGTTVVPRVRNDIIGELHGRVAYGSSCLLLVALGAALGIVFRGGHFISAFAISIVPAAVVIVMIVMGKQMISNPDVSPTWGLAAIWAGIVAMVVADLVVYGRLMRK